MARPTSKGSLVTLAKENYQRLISLIEALPERQREKAFPEGTMNRNIRDVIGHLYYWHLLFLNWYEEGMKGGKPKIPKEGYTMKDTPKLNQEIWEQCQEVSLTEMLSLFEATHNKVFQFILKHTDEELFTKKKYHWTGSTSLGSYLVSATSSHYDWALKLIRKSIKKK
ncbi:ClbS/DfsB family four-helix bundle protein [Capnocytophaga sp. G2]|uniref:ClbS/DfsB family four-helix bundle protein n=1 Tax=Capnocytophaga sp. G2 TaxID=3110695 RepID=UPI002B4A40C7|nr:ClbS/DfsB family four-helix bundle protein [Capnocytophaga sp. G2]MEB3005090.1 ClbS/DfsB family four-helix bundle protein [Capnocytophaga sp. G2]